MSLLTPDTAADFVLIDLVKEVRKNAKAGEARFTAVYQSATTEPRNGLSFYSPVAGRVVFDCKKYKEKDDHVGLVLEFSDTAPFSTELYRRETELIERLGEEVRTVYRRTSPGLGYIQLRLKLYDESIILDVRGGQVRPGRFLDLKAKESVKVAVAVEGIDVFLIDGELSHCPRIRALQVQIVDAPPVLPTSRMF